MSNPAQSVADGTKEAAAVDGVELRVGQLDFRVHLFDVLHRGLVMHRHLSVQIGGPFRRRYGGDHPLLMHNRRSEMKTRSFAV
jgi:hypothetical protein